MSEKDGDLGFAFDFGGASSDGDNAADFDTNVIPKGLRCQNCGSSSLQSLEDGTQLQCRNCFAEVTGHALNAQIDDF